LEVSVLAEKTLTVRLVAQIDQYQQSMKAAAKSTDELVASGARLQIVGKQISNVGDTLTKNVTLPLVAVGAAATVMATNFDKSFTTMQTLAGVSAGEVDHLKESVLDLAGETGRAPQELADALYFLQSSGLDSAQAMDALEVSAKASAAGLGSTEVIADAVSSAMLGYAKSGLTAAEATDVLVETARQGKAEPAELAAQMGRLIPIASELGITFGDVGGAIAALSTKGFNAEQATTALVNVMGKLLKPSEQAKEMLEAVGLSTDTIRQSIAEKGLLATLEELRAKLGENGFVKFLEDQQAVQGGLALLGGDLNATKAIFAEVNDSVGATDNAFSTWAESMGAQNARAFADFQVALIGLGDIIAPIATDVIGALSSIADAFGSLPDGVQQAIVYVALFAAALGPILSIGGRVITLVGTLARLLPQLAVPAGSVSGAFNGAATSVSGFGSALRTLGIVGAVVGSLFLLREAIGTVNDEVDRAKLGTLENQLLDLADTGEASGATLKRVFDGLFGDIGPGVEGFSRMTAQAKADLDSLDDALASLAGKDAEAAADAFEHISEALQGQGFSAGQVKERFDSYTEAVASADTSNRTTQSAIDEATGAIDGQTGALEEAQSALQAYIDTLKAQFDPQFAMIDAMQSSAEAQQELRDSLAALNEARAGGDVEAVTEAEARYADAVNGARSSVVDLQSAANALKDSMAENGFTAEEVSAKFVDLAVQQGFTAEEALVMAEAFGIATGTADTLGRTDPNVAVSETGAMGVQEQLRSTTNEARGIPNTVHVGVFAETHSARLGIAGVGQALNDIDGRQATVTVKQLFTSVGQAFGFASGRASGGPVDVNMPYLVGEEGPELFVPAVNGRILSHADSMRRLASGGPVRLGSVSSEIWNQLMAAGWRGSPTDGMEALYPPEELAKMPIRQGSVTDDMWDYLKSIGYLGHAGDNMEALYSPAARWDGGSVTVVNYSLTFNGPTNDTQVVEAIQRHERRNGTTWRD
jgi:TP901 family phage tail tape measure protein